MGSENRSPVPYERRVALLATAAGVPGTALGLALLWTGGYSLRLEWTGTVLVVLVWLALVVRLRREIDFPLRTLSNLLEALREGDYTLRARGSRQGGAMGEVLGEVNELRSTLLAERLGAREATALLHRVMEEIDVAVFTFDGGDRLRLVNRAGERILAQPAESILGRSAEELGLAACLRGDASRTFEAVFPGGEGRWGMRRGTFREGGLPHQLLVISDLSQTLREEERQAWRRLIRVIGHEINNSLAPIKSMAGTLSSLLARDPRAEDWEADMGEGLSVIAERSDALIRFMGAYSRLARLPSPRPRPAALGPLVRRAAALEDRLPVVVEGGPDLTLEVDADQLEQVLINLIQNAADAALETGGGVRAGWRVTARQAEVWIQDDGPGLGNRENLFVPFYSTKPGGTGIGLVLSRQIAEAHGGSLVLDDRADSRGCQARLRLPLR